MHEGEGQKQTHYVTTSNVDKRTQRVHALLNWPKQGLPAKTERSTNIAYWRDQAFKDRTRQRARTDYTRKAGHGEQAEWRNVESAIKSQQGRVIDGSVGFGKSESRLTQFRINRQKVKRRNESKRPNQWTWEPAWGEFTLEPSAQVACRAPLKWATRSLVRLECNEDRSRQGSLTGQWGWLTYWKSSKRPLVAWIEFSKF